MAEPNLQEIHDLLVDIALKAGRMMTSARPSRGGTDTKINSTDLVTATDKEIETMVSTTLKQHYPSYEFLGEETYTPGTPLTAAPTFICDPIDGTTNFVHGNPNVCIALAFTLARRPLVGVVYNPFLRHLHHARHGHGAFLTPVVQESRTTTTTVSSAPASASASAAGDPVAETRRTGDETLKLGESARLPLRDPPAPLPGLRDALLAHEWGNERAGPNWAAKTGTFMKLCGAGGGMVRGLRSTGSSALNVCAVAAGGVDAYWEGGCWAWDVAGAWCILEEAGGLMASANPGEEARVDGRVYLAVRGVGARGEAGRAMQRRFVEEVWGCVEGRLEYDV